MQRRDNYACNRVRIFLNELGQGTHNSKFKALNDFHSYLDTHRPLISDDTVDFLLTGELDSFKTTGLLKHIGSLSEKKKGEGGGELLKRISACLIRLLKYLVIDIVQEESIYFDRFIRLDPVYYTPMRLDLHILGGNKLTDLKSSNSTASTSTAAEVTTDSAATAEAPSTIQSFRNYSKIYLKYSQYRGGNSTEAFEITKLLYENHLNINDEFEEINLLELFHNNKNCLKSFFLWYKNYNNSFSLDDFDTIHENTSAAAVSTSASDATSAFSILPSVGGVAAVDNPLSPGDIDNLNLDIPSIGMNAGQTFGGSSNFEEIISNNSLSTSILAKNNKKNYPNTWKKLNYTKLSIQHDEIAERNFFILENNKRNKEIKKNNKKEEEKKSFKDPLNIYDINLYDIEKLYKKKKISNQQNKKKFLKLLEDDIDGETSEERGRSPSIASSTGTPIRDDDEDEEEEEEDLYDHYDDDDDGEEDDEEDHSDDSPLVKKKKKSSSILPINKNFSITNYLKIIHKKTSFPNLVVGMKNLEKTLLNYNNYRNYLIVKFYNNFIEFYEEIYWLKLYRFHILKNEKNDELVSTSSTDNYSSDFSTSKYFKNLNTGINSLTVSMLGDLEELFDKDKEKKIQIINGQVKLHNILKLINMIKKKNVYILYPIIKKKKNFFIIKKLKVLLKNSIKNIIKYPSILLYNIKKNLFNNIYVLFKTIFLLKNSIKIFINIKNICNNILLNYFNNLFSFLLCNNNQFLTNFQDIHPRNFNGIISASNSFAGNLISTCRIFLSIQGPIYYLVALRQTFIRFFFNFLEKLKEIRNKFVVDSLDALNSGNELFLNSTASGDIGGGGNPTSNIFNPNFFGSTPSNAPPSSSAAGSSSNINNQNDLPDENNFFNQFINEKSLIQLFSIIKRYTSNNFFPCNLSPNSSSGVNYSSSFNSNLFSSFSSAESSKKYTSDTQSDIGVENEYEETSSSIFTLNPSPNAPTSPSTNQNSPLTSYPSSYVNVNEIMREELDDEIDYSLENCIYDFFLNNYNNVNNLSSPTSVGPAGPSSGFLNGKHGARGNSFLSVYSTNTSPAETSSLPTSTLPNVSNPFATSAQSAKELKKIDYTFLLCNVIRRNFIENILLLLFHYYPLLFSLHYEILRFSAQELPSFLDNASLALVNFSGGAIGGLGAASRPGGVTGGGKGTGSSTTYPYPSSTLLADINLAIFDPYINMYFSKKNWFNLANKNNLIGNLTDLSTSNCLNYILNCSLDFVYQGLTGIGTQVDSISANNNIKKPLINNETNLILKEFSIFVNILYHKINFSVIKFDSQDILPFSMEGLTPLGGHSGSGAPPRPPTASSYSETIINFHFHSNFPLENQKFYEVGSMNYFKTSLVGNFYSSSLQNIMFFYDFLENSYQKANEILMDKDKNDTNLQKEEVKNEEEVKKKEKTSKEKPSKVASTSSPYFNTQSISQDYLDLNILSPTSRTNRSYILLQALIKEAQLLYLYKVNKKFIEKINLIFLVCVNNIKKKNFFLVFYNNLVKKLKFYYKIKKINQKIKKKILLNIKNSSNTNSVLKNKNIINPSSSFNTTRFILPQENDYDSYRNETEDEDIDDDNEEVSGGSVRRRKDDDEDYERDENENEDDNDDEEIEDEELYIDKILLKINNIKKLYQIPYGFENFIIQYENLTEFFNQYLKKKKFFLSLSYNFYILFFINNLSYIFRKIQRFYVEKSNFLIKPVENDQDVNIYQVNNEDFDEFQHGDENEKSIETLLEEAKAKAASINPFSSASAASVTAAANLRLNKIRKDMKSLEEELLSNEGMTYEKEMTSLFTSSSSSSIINRDSSSKKTSPISSSNIKTDLFFASYAHHNTLAHLISLLTSASSASATTSFTSSNPSSNNPNSPSNGENSPTSSASSSTCFPLSSSNDYLLNLTANFDLIRGLLRLRTYTISKILSNCNKVFPISCIQDSFNSTISNSFTLFYSINSIYNFQNNVSLLPSQAISPPSNVKATIPVTLTFPNKIKSTTDQIFDSFLMVQSDTKLGSILKSASTVNSSTNSEMSTPSSCISKFLMKIYRDTISLELTSFFAYINSRLKNYRTLIETGYTDMVKRERKLNQLLQLQSISPSKIDSSYNNSISSLPTHIIKICLLLHEDKRILTQFLYNSSLIYGNNSNGNYTLTSLSSMIAKNPSLFSINSLPLHYSTSDYIITSKYNSSAASSSSNYNSTSTSSSTASSTSPLFSSPFYTTYPINSFLNSSSNSDTNLLQNSQDIEDIIKTANTQLDNNLNLNINLLNNNKFYLINYTNFFCIELYKNILVYYQQEIQKIKKNLYNFSNFDENYIYFDDKISHNSSNSDKLKNMTMAQAAALVATNVNDNFTPYATLAQAIEEFEFLKFTFISIVKSKKFRIDEDLKEILSYVVELSQEEKNNIEIVKNKFASSKINFIDAKESLVKNSQILFQLFS